MRIFGAMKKGLVLFTIVVCATACTVAMRNQPSTGKVLNIPAGTYEDTLRFLYSLPPEQWPAPAIAEGIVWNELGILPASPLQPYMDSLKAMIELGKTLFFDTRLSGSLKISCATCHLPEKAWTDGLDKSIGHNGAINKRNSPSLHNVWFYKKLFWDGRSSSLEDQAFSPINSESEMAHDMRMLPAVLRKNAAYKKMFAVAFGDDYIEPDRIAEALAQFQRTIVSNESRFDLFLKGDHTVLNNREISGLHIFRTKAGCMNCHNGALLSDNNFHNNGFANGDEGRYFMTHLEKDKGVFKTPSLRDVAFTGPWMHDGAQKTLENIIERYNSGSGPGADTLIKVLNLTAQEKADLLAFLKAVSAPPVNFTKPLLPAD